jgi:hypothetical protein
MAQGVKQIPDRARRELLKALRMLGSEHAAERASAAMPVALLANRPRSCSGAAAATAAGEFVKKKTRRPDPTLGQDSQRRA